MAKKHRNILLNDINDTTTTNHQGSFTWEFHDYKKNITVKIMLDRWWIKCLSENLWEVVNDERAELDKLSESMKNKQEQEQ